MTADGALNAIIITTLVVTVIIVVGGELLHRWRQR
jgi:hypothetical protein